jgi:hypothetical protein
VRQLLLSPQECPLLTSKFDFILFLYNRKINEESDRLKLINSKIDELTVMVGKVQISRPQPQMALNAPIERARDDSDGRLLEIQQQIKQLRDQATAV